MKHMLLYWYNGVRRGMTELETLNIYVTQETFLMVENVIETMTFLHQWHCLELALSNGGPR